MTDDHDDRTLVERARAGDHTAWDALVQRYRSMLARIGRSYRLPPADVQDVVQTTWLRLFESLGRIRDPRCLPGWLATTARRECLRVLRRTARETPSEDGDRRESTAFQDPGAQLIVDVERTAVRDAVADLAPRHRALVDLLLTTDRPSYIEVSRELGMPIGSIGPTRQRAMRRLREHPSIMALAA